jgi:thioredoxin 1
MLKHLENTNFNDELKDKKVLVDFYADWCGPCQMLGPVLEEINTIDILKVNTDEHEDVARDYGIMSIPTMIIFENGKEIKRVIGYHTKDEIEKIISEI